MKWDAIEFQKRLLAAREKSGLKQEELGAKLNRGKSAISQWENGVNVPTLSQICDIAEALHTEPSFVAFGDEFTPMDDEEKETIGLWRKMSEPERLGFLNTFKAITAARNITKKPGPRTRKRAKHASAPVGYAPVPHLKSELSVVGKGLAAAMSETEVELPARFWTALESVATLLHQLNAPQVAICQTVPPQEAGGLFQDDG